MDRHARGLLSVILLAALSAAWPVQGSAAVIPISTSAADFASLGNWTPAGAPLITTMIQAVGSSVVSGDVTSQAFYDAQQSTYAYLYQIKNTGGAGDHIIEVFTVYPFFGAGGSTQLGYLNANIPGAFSLGAQNPVGASVDTSTADGSTISFGFYAFLGSQIDTGETSATLYVLSPLSPALITGNIIDGGIAQGPVVGPIPEPALLGMIGLGSVLALRRRRN